MYSVTVYTGDATGTGLVVVLGSETNKMAEGEGRVSHLFRKEHNGAIPSICGEPHYVGNHEKRGGFWNVKKVGKEEDAA